MHPASKRLVRTSIVIRLSVVLTCAALATTCLAGCLSQQEFTYQNKIRELSKRSNEISRKFNETMKAFDGQAQAMFATQPGSAQQALDQVNQLLDMFSPKFQQFMADIQQVQADLNNLQVPPKYATAHSIYISGMSSFVVSVQQVFNGFEMMRNISTIQEALPTIETANTYIKQGIDNLDKADNMVFSTNWGLIVGVIIGFFAVVALIIAFFVYLNRRRRYQPGQLAPGPIHAYPGPGYPPPPAAYRSPSEAYPPPPVPYRPPSEAYSPPPGDIYSPPATQGYPPPPQPGYPPPAEADTLQPGTPPNAPPRKPVTCPRCGAEVTSAGAFCPSCNTMMPGV
jgi:outer membrane murein-binding lipoprotein Lpp